MVEVLDILDVLQKAIHVIDLVLALEAALVDENRDFSRQFPILCQLVVVQVRLLLDEVGQLLNVFAIKLIDVDLGLNLLVKGQAVILFNAVFCICLRVTETSHRHIRSELHSAVLGVQTLPIDRVLLLQRFYLLLVILILLDGFPHDLGLRVRVLKEDLIEMLQLNRVEGTVDHRDRFAVPHLVKKGILVSKQITFEVALED